MGAKISASNAVVSAVEQAAALYGVRSYRMNSRTFQVAGAGGRQRPMFMGAWHDATGQVHHRGMADLLLTPQVPLSRFTPPTALVHIPMNHNTTGGMPADPRVTVVLWVECKSGRGALEAEQKAFRTDVFNAGAFYIQAQDDADDVVAWFEKMGVRR